MEFEKYCSKEFYRKLGYDPRKKNKMGNPKSFTLIITYDLLAKIFFVPRERIKKWVYAKKIDPNSLEDIIDKYTNPWKLDGRKKK
jgi:hypothetical protein